MTARSEGAWKELATSAGGNPSYCTLGQHFFTGRGWAWVEDATPLVSRHICCGACAAQVGTADRIAEVLTR